MMTALTTSFTSNVVVILMEKFSRIIDHKVCSAVECSREDNFGLIAVLMCSIMSGIRTVLTLSLIHIQMCIRDRFYTNCVPLEKYLTANAGWLNSWKKDQFIMSDGWLSFNELAILYLMKILNAD